MQPVLCPKCGAYWDCDCIIEPEPLPPLDESLIMPIDDSCDHDWLDAVGVELDIDHDEESQLRVVVCRICGAYALSRPE